MVAAPPGFPEPLSVALVPVTSVAALVVTTGPAAGTVKDSGTPNAVPMGLLAIAQKKYVAPGVRPLSVCV